MKKIREMCVQELIDIFILNKYKYNSKAYIGAGQVLHSKIESIVDILPMLKSDTWEAQSMAVYIASEEGVRACSIMDEIVPLLNSKWIDIKDDACDCFTSCGDRAEQFLKLLELLEDPDERIRIKVIQVLFNLKEEKIKLIYDFICDNKYYKFLSKGLHLILRSKNNEVSIENIEDIVLTESKIYKVCSYIAAYHATKDVNILTEVANLSNDADIQKHFNIYLKDT